MSCVRMVLGIGLACLAGGCVSSGLSPREVRGQDYSTQVFSMYDGPGGAEGPRTLTLPADVVVAQLGEVAPPSAMMERLRKDANFSLVQPIPGLVDLEGRMRFGGVPADRVGEAHRLAQAQSERMLRYAKDLGAKYLFLFGGTLDQSTTGTRMSLANATIVGAFVVPSDSVKGTVRGSGALVDVATGRVVLSVSADSSREILSAPAARIGNEQKLARDLRDDVTIKLAEQLCARVKEKVAGKG